MFSPRVRAHKTLKVWGLATVKQTDCYWILFIPLIGVNLGAPMILAMGIDRIIAIIFPAKQVFELLD